MSKVKNSRLPDRTLTQPHPFSDTHSRRIISHSKHRSVQLNSHMGGVDTYEEACMQLYGTDRKSKSGGSDYSLISWTW